MSKHRNAALALHGLHPEDQRWVLAQLGKDDRTTLHAYLVELKELGIPTDLETMPAASAPAPAAAPSLRTAAVAQIAVLLADEPLWLVGCLLGLEEWTWKSSYLASLPPAQRKQLGYSQRSQLAEQAARSLVARFEAKLATCGTSISHNQVTVPIASPRRRTLLLSMRRTVRRWF